MKRFSIIFVPATLVFLCALILTKATERKLKEKIYIKDAIIICIPTTVNADTKMNEAGAHIKFQTYQKTDNKLMQPFTCYITLIKNDALDTLKSHAYFQPVGLPDLSLSQTNVNGIYEQFFGGRGIVFVHFATNKLLKEKLLFPEKHAQFFSSLDQAVRYLRNRLSP